MSLTEKTDCFGNPKAIIYNLFIVSPLSGYLLLYYDQINARTLIGKLAMRYCAGKPTKKLRVF